MWPLCSWSITPARRTSSGQPRDSAVQISKRQALASLVGIRDPESVVSDSCHSQIDEGEWLPRGETTDLWKHGYVANDPMKVRMKKTLRTKRSTSGSMKPKPARPWHTLTWSPLPDKCAGGCITPPVLDCGHVATGRRQDHHKNFRHIFENCLHAITDRTGEEVRDPFPALTADSVGHS